MSPQGPRPRRRWVARRDLRKLASVLCCAYEAGASSRLLHRVPAADVERLGRHPTRLLGSEEDDDVSDVLWPTHAWGRVRSGHLLLHLGGDPPRLHRPEGDRVHRYAKGPELHGRAPGVALERQLARAVGDLAPEDVRAVRADVDYAPPTRAPLHVPPRELRDH